MYSRREQPCATCPACHECWNYTKVPDGGKPGGAWLIRGWFDCHREAGPRPMELGDLYPTQVFGTASPLAIQGWYAWIHAFRA